MDWIAILIACVFAYAAIAIVIHSKKLFPDHVGFYGPFLALRSKRVGFFDLFRRYTPVFRMYGTFGALFVIGVSVSMVVLLFFSLHYNLVTQPLPTAINKPQNILAIPGVNEFIPFTIPVWIAFMVTLIVHEFGHGILARVENIRLKYIGALFLVIPVGAFVEPDEEEFENAGKASKIRMLGAGITNNMVVGLICFGLLVAMLGMAAPTDVPLIKSVYVGYPAANASVPPNTIITGINGAAVTSRSQVSGILNRTRPGDVLTLDLEKGGLTSAYTLKLAEWPETADGRTGGFMGVAYYDAPTLKTFFDTLGSPIGVLFILAVPIQVIIDPSLWGNFIILLNDTVDAVAWVAPFPGYWAVIQILFWCAWFNIMVALCNALPMVPLDGGYILKEGTERLLEKSEYVKYSGQVASIVSILVLGVLVLVFMLPILLHL